MQLKPGCRLSLCYKNKVHLVEVFARASKQLLGVVDHRQDLSNDQLEGFVKKLAADSGLVAVPALYAAGTFYLEVPQS